MTQKAQSQLRQLIRENKIKRDSTPRSASSFTCNIITERKMKAEIAEKIISEKLVEKWN